MNALQEFKFNQSNVRVVLINSEPWWVVKDVCEIINLSNTSMATYGLDPEEKGISEVDTLGGKQNMSIVNESGLYALILRSNKPEAKAFRKWVTSEVLPQIRKTGSYSVKELSRKDLALMIIQAEEELEAKNSIIIEQNRQITVATNRIIEQQPKVDGWNEFIGCDGLVELNHVAQICKTGRNTLFKKLRDEKVFYYKGAYNSVYQQYVDAGYFEMKMVPNEELGPIPVIKCTPKGAEWIYNKFYRKAA